MSPLHVRTAAQADLDDLARSFGGHASTLGREEDGYDGLSGAVAEWLGRGLQSLVQQFESARRLYWDGREPRLRVRFRTRLVVTRVVSSLLENRLN